MKKILALFKAAFLTLVIAGMVKKPDSIYKNNPKERNPHEGKQVKFIENPADPQNADGVCGHLEDIGDTAHAPTFYESVIKRTIDIILSFFGLILLSPILLILSLWIVIDDPGPILFTQKRVGKDKQFFKLHKFRSMKTNTPHDKPTHMLDNPDQYITNAGRFMRKHSLDLLTAERDKYGENDIKLGLTGWA